MNIRYIIIKYNHKDNVTTMWNTNYLSAFNFGWGLSTFFFAAPFMRFLRLDKTSSPALQSHTHTHTCTNPFDGPFSGTIQVSWYQKGKSILILLKQETVSSSGISWAICKSAPCSRQITMPAPQHSVFYRLDACHPTNSIEALKALESSNCNSQFTLSKVHTFKKFLT